MKNKSLEKIKRINLRVTKSQFNQIKSNAKAINYPISKYIRATSLHNSLNSVRKPENEYQRSTALNTKLNGLERKYQGIGENLNQVMKQCYIYGLDKNHDELLQQVEVARQEVHQLDNDVQKLKK